MDRSSKHTSDVIRLAEDSMTRMSQLQAQIRALQEEVERDQSGVRSMLCDELGVSAGDVMFNHLCLRYELDPFPSDAESSKDSSSASSGSEAAIVHPEASPVPVPERRIPVPMPREVPDDHSGVVVAPSVTSPAVPAEPDRAAVAPPPKPAVKKAPSKIEILGVEVSAAHEELAREIVALAETHARMGKPTSKYSNNRGKNSWRAKLFEQAYLDAESRLSVTAKPTSPPSADAPAQQDPATSRDMRFLPAESVEEDLDPTPSEEFDGPSVADVPAPGDDPGDTSGDEYQGYMPVKPTTPIPKPVDLPEQVHQASRPRRPARPGFLKN